MSDERVTWPSVGGRSAQYERVCAFDNLGGCTCYDHKNVVLATGGGNLCCFVDDGSKAGRAWTMPQTGGVHTPVSGLSTTPSPPHNSSNSCSAVSHLTA